MAMTGFMFPQKTRHASGRAGAWIAPFSPSKQMQGELLGSGAMDTERPEDECEDGTSIHSAYATFVCEAARIVELLSSLDTNLSAEGIICTILDKYQEQCQLLDPHLENIVQHLFRLIKNSGPASMHCSCRVLYTLCKVRGFKTVVKFFPHEVSDLEPCLTLLQNEDPANLESWSTRYILLLWLSILVMVPFCLKTVDSKAADSSQGLIGQILEICKSSLHESARTRDGAAYLLAILLTRPDMESSYLVCYLQWCREQLNGKSNPFLSAGIYSSLASIFKYGQRQSMLDKVPIVLDALAELDHQNGQADHLRTTLQRKLICKLAQRLGLTYVPIRVASWRYQRGCRSLLENLNKNITKKNEDLDISCGGVSSNVVCSPGDVASPHDEDDSYVPAEIDYIVDHMLRAMRDRDTVVRWSGAKGVGRLTGRLPRHLADEVVAAVLQQFVIEGDQDSAWHGGCLALAELARRGLLLPARLHEVVPYVLKALRYDVRKGSASVGAHVRDAACYVCWAFARAYAPAVMQPYVCELSKALIVAAVYDREINCRRAASAAFQENVGRQGLFPHGIDILTKADYFTLGNRASAYLDISIFVAQFKEYRYALIDFLVQVQLRHWDKNMRMLSASTLRPLTKCDSSYVIKNVLSELLQCTLSQDLPTRHGCTLAIAEVILGFSDAAYALEPMWHERFIDIVPQIEKARLYRGRGGEIMRGASCRIIEALPLAGILLNPKAIARLMESVDENVKHPTEDIQGAAVGALKSMSDHCFSTMPLEWQGKLVKKYLAALGDANPAVRRGFALAIGALNKQLLDSNLPHVLNTMVKYATLIQDRIEDRDAESRRNAVMGLIRVCQTVGIRQCFVEQQTGVYDGLDKPFVDLVFNGLLKGMEDYSTDHRGDVGSWVREASMRGLKEFALMLISADRMPSAGLAVFSNEMRLRLICCLLQQLGEKIDRVRECAGTVLHSILSKVNIDLLVPCELDQELLQAAILLRENNGEVEVDWSAPSATFPRLVKLLDSPTFLIPVLTGLLISCGGLTESLVRHSWASFFEHIQRNRTSSRLVWCISDALVEILKCNFRNDRVVLPLFNTLNLLLTNGCFDDVKCPESQFVPNLVELVQAEMRGCKDVAKLQSGASVVCCLSSMGEAGSNLIRDRCLATLLSLLCHKYPKVRKHVADIIYMQLLTHGDTDSFHGLNEAMEVLSEVDWFDDAACIREKRDCLYPLLGIKKPDPAQPSSNLPAAAKLGEETTPSGQAAGGVGYADLVKEMHY